MTRSLFSATTVLLLLALGCALVEGSPMLLSGTVDKDGNVITIDTDGIDLGVRGRTRKVKVVTPAGQVSVSGSLPTGDQVAPVTGQVNTTSSKPGEGQTPQTQGVQQAQTLPTTQQGASPPELRKGEAEPNLKDPAPKETQPAPKETQPAPKGTQPAPKGTQPDPKGTQPDPKGTQPDPKGTQPDQKMTPTVEATSRNDTSPVKGQEGADPVTVSNPSDAATKTSQTDGAAKTSQPEAKEMPPTPGEKQPEPKKTQQQPATPQPPNTTVETDQQREGLKPIPKEAKKPSSETPGDQVKAPESQKKGDAEKEAIRMLEASPLKPMDACATVWMPAQLLALIMAFIGISMAF